MSAKMRQDARDLLEREALERGSDLHEINAWERGSCFVFTEVFSDVSWTICSQLQRLLPNKMFRTKGILLVITLFCFRGVISAPCPRSVYSNLTDTLQSPGFSEGKYPPNQNCTYNIRVSAGKRIILAFDFERFNIWGNMPNCSQDSLEIIVG